MRASVSRWNDSCDFICDGCFSFKWLHIVFTTLYHLGEEFSPAIQRHDGRTKYSANQTFRTWSNIKIPFVNSVSEQNAEGCMFMACKVCWGKHLIRRETNQGDSNGQILIKFYFGRFSRSSSSVDDIEIKGKTTAFCPKKSNKQNDKHTCLLFLGEWMFQSAPVLGFLLVQHCYGFSKWKTNSWVMNNLPSQQETATGSSVVTVCVIIRNMSRNWPSKSDMLLLTLSAQYHSGCCQRDHG